MAFSLYRGSIMRLRKIKTEATIDVIDQAFSDFVSLWNKEHREKMEVMSNDTVAVAEGNKELWVATNVGFGINLKHYTLTEDSLFPIDDIKKPMSVIKA